MVVAYIGTRYVNSLVTFKPIREGLLFTAGLRFFPASPSKCKVGWNG
jgi:hypothetical protein